MANVTFIEDLREVAEQTAQGARAAFRAVGALQDVQVASKWTDDECRLLQATAKAFGIPTRHRQTRFVLGNVAKELAADISQVRVDGGKTLVAFAGKADVALLRGAGVAPSGANHETALALALAVGGVPGDVERAEVARQLIRSNLALAYQVCVVEALARGLVERPAAMPYELPAVGQADEVKRIALARARLLG